MARGRSGRSLQHLVLARRLSTLREAAGLSPKQAADALGAHPATVRRIEQAKTSLDEGQVHTLLTAYGVAREEIQQFLDKVATANLPGWWHPWHAVMDTWQLNAMSIESAARLIRVWEPALVPALLRTPEYARAVDEVMRPDLTPEEKDLRADLLQERQKRLVAQETRLWALISAAALHTQVGSPETMAGQIEALRATTERREVSIQIQPLDGPPHPLTGIPALTFYRVDLPGLPDYLVREGGLPGRVDVWDRLETVAEYRQLLDSSCLTASHPNRLREVLS